MRRVAWLGLALLAGGAVALLLAPGAAACHSLELPETSFHFFRDVTSDACVRFAHSTWSGTNPTYLETVGAGVCAADVDRDRLVDFYLTNGREAGGNAMSALFRNLGATDTAQTTKFANITASARVGRVGWSTGCAFGDYDNDGDPDLYVAGYDGGTLYRNNGRAVFADVTDEAGVANQDCGIGEFLCWGSSVAWLDHDRDGDLDLFVANYIDLSPDYTGSLNPTAFHGQPNALFRNDGPDSGGAWRFTEVGEQAGVQYNSQQSLGRSLGVSVADYDRDGWPDLLVANDEDAAAVYHNNHDGTFSEVSGSLGLVDSRGNMGVDFGDVDGDGFPEAFITHFGASGELNGYWRASGGTYTDATVEVGLDQPPEYHQPGADGAVGWGTNFVDLDNDGYWDLWVNNGHANIDGADVETYRQPGLLYTWDPANGRFTHWGGTDAGDAGWIGLERIGRGAAFVDYDNDGDVDILAANNRFEPSILRNHARGVGSDPSPFRDNHFITVKLEGKTSPCEPWGATATLTVGGRSFGRALGNGGSYQSGNEPRLHFGLGTATTATLDIDWPSGAHETKAIGAAELDRVFTLREQFDAPPPAPGAPTVSLTDTGATVRWKPVSACDFARYEVHLGLTADFTPSSATLLATAGGRDLGSAQVTDLPENVTRYVRVVAVDGAGQTTPSPATMAVLPDRAPPPVTVQAPEVAGPFAANVTWGATDASDFARYEVHAALEQGFQPNASTLRVTVRERTTTSARAEGLVDDADNWLRVVVVDLGGNAAASQAVVVHLPNAAPPAPVLEAPEAGRTTFNVTLVWGAAPRDFARYEVHASRSPGFAPGEATLIATRTQPVTQHVATGLDPNTTYHFRVVVVDAGGLRTASAELAASTLAIEIPAVQLEPVGEVGRGYAVLRWSRSGAAGFQAYIVHLSTSAGFTPVSATRIGQAASLEATSFNATNLLPSTTYAARVVTATLYGASASNEVSFTTPAGPDPRGPAADEPLAPTGGPGGSTGGVVDAASLGPLEMLGPWVEPTASGLTVHWVTNRPSSGVVLFDGAEVGRDPVLRVEHYVTLNGLSPERAYKMVLIATDAHGVEARAQSDVATPPALPPPAPRDLQVSPDATGVSLTWRLPTNLSQVHRIRVYREVGAEGADSAAPELLAELLPAVRALHDTPPSAPWVRYKVTSLDTFGRESPDPPSVVHDPSKPRAGVLGAQALGAPEAALAGGVMVAMALALAARRRR